MENLLFKEVITMKKWALFTLEDEIEQTKETVKAAGLEPFEVREVSLIEKLAYGIPVSAPLWIVMFEATEDEYNALIQKNELTKVF
jgi:hypothetical protein